MLNVRRGLLPLIIAVHLAVFWYWSTARHAVQDAPAHKVTEIFFIPLKMATPPPPIAPPTRPTPPAPSTPRRVAPALSNKPPQAITPERPASVAPAAEALAEPEPAISPPVAPAETMLQRSRRLAGGVDRELRKESWNPRDKNIVQDQSKLSRDIASAFRDQSARMEDVTLPDGRHMSKIHTPGGTYCGEVQSNALTGGRDPFKDGVKTQYQTCKQ